MGPPKFDTSTPEACIGLRMLQSSRTGLTFTLRDAKRLMKEPPKKYEPEEWEATAQHYLESGILRSFIKVAGPGRPTIHLYPTQVLTLRMGDGNKVIFGEWDDQALVAPPITEGLVEVDAPWSQSVNVKSNLDRGGDHNTPAVQTPAAPAQQEPEAVQQPEQHSQHSQHPAQRENPTRPEQVIGLDDPVRKQRAYALLRSLVRKSIQERDYGPTSREILRGMIAKGFTKEQAFWYLRMLSGYSIEGWREDGLRLEGPNSPRNGTTSPRWYLRTPGQSLDDPEAEFEIEKRRQYQHSRPVDIDGLLSGG